MARRNRAWLWSRRHYSGGTYVPGLHQIGMESRYYFLQQPCTKIEDDIRGSKFKARWTGPWKVVAVRKDGNDIEMDGKTRTRTVEFLFKVYSSFELLEPEKTRDDREDKEPEELDIGAEDDDVASNTERLAVRRGAEEAKGRKLEKDVPKK